MHPKRPGRRLDGYRNSIPRTVALIGIGAVAASAAQMVAASSSRIVLLAASDKLDWHTLTSVAPCDMVVVVCSGNVTFDVPQSPHGLDVLVSNIVIVDGSNTDCTPITYPLRNIADLFLTLTDPADIADVVLNLSS